MPDLIPRRRVLAALGLMGLARPAAAQEPTPCETADSVGGWRGFADQHSFRLSGDAVAWETIGEPRTDVRPLSLNFLNPTPLTRDGARGSTILAELYLPVFDMALPPDGQLLAAFATPETRTARGLQGAALNYNYGIGVFVGDDPIVVETKKFDTVLHDLPYAYFRFEAGEAWRLVAALIDDVPIRVQVELGAGRAGEPNVVVAAAWVTGLGTFGAAVDWGLAGVARQRGLPEAQRCEAEACYVTTACVGAVGLADDCWEMRSLRAFRDGPLAGSDGGAGLIAEYYARAPAVVAAIHARPDARRIWLATYFAGVLPAALAAKAGLTRLARAIYVRQVRRLERLAADAERAGAG